MLTRLCASIVVAALIGGCAADTPANETASGSVTPTASTSTGLASARPPSVTGRLDSIAVLGHSGATGATAPAHGRTRSTRAARAT